MSSSLSAHGLGITLSWNDLGVTNQSTSSGVRQTEPNLVYSLAPPCTPPPEMLDRVYSLHTMPGTEKVKDAKRKQLDKLRKGGVLQDNWLTLFSKSV